jgi:hypothetical protein
VKALRFVPTLALLGLAVLAALLAADVRGWERTVRSGDALLAAQPAAATWQASPRLPWDPAGRLLGVGDDVRARRAIRLFQRTVHLQGRLDNALDVTAARARAEAALAAVADGSGPRASQAGTLLGVLAYGDFARSGSSDANQTQAAIGDFTAAVRADPADETAKFDLELLLRSLAVRGERTGPTGTAGVGATGRHGAGGGTPGEGY